MSGNATNQDLGRGARVSGNLASSLQLTALIEFDEIIVAHLTPK